MTTKRSRVLIFGHNEAPQEVMEKLGEVAEIVSLPPTVGEEAKQSIIKAVEEHGTFDAFAAIVHPRYPVCKRWDADNLGPLKQSCRCYIVSTAGHDGLDYKWITSHGAYLANSPSEMGIRTADGTLMLLLATFHGFPKQDADIRNSPDYTVWRDLDWNSPHINWRTQTIGIIGMGNIGKRVAGMCTALGMKVIYHNRKPASPPCDYEYVDLDGLYKRADVVILLCPLTEETRHIVNKESISKMKDGVIIGNVTRGGCMDQEALIEALESGKVSRVFLDVYETEPKIPQALKDNRNAILWPHWAPGTSDLFRANAGEVMESLIALCKTGKPNNAVNEADLRPLSDVGQQK